MSFIMEEMVLPKGTCILQFHKSIFFDQHQDGKPEYMNDTLHIAYFTSQLSITEFEYGIYC